MSTSPVDRSHRRLAVTGLVGSSLLLAASVLLQPDLTGPDRLAAVHDAGWRAAVSAVAFVLGQFPYVAAALGIAHLVQGRAHRLAVTGAALSVVGALGHAVIGGVSLVEVAMARDTAHRAVLASFDQRLQGSPVMVFSMIGLLGFVVGLLLLSIGLFRGHVGPRWVGPAIWVFLVVEFLGTSLSGRASYLSATILVVVFVTLARQANAAWDADRALDPRDDRAEQLAHP
jgi:hypothetical protein